MAFALYSLLEAVKFSQLPKMLQEVITEDLERRDMFQEKFLDYDEKDRWSCIKAAMDTCLTKGMYQERAFYHILFLQEIRGEEIDDQWEEMIEENCEENETQTTNCGTQTEPIAIQTEEPKQEVTIPTLTSEPPFRVVRRKYNATDSSFRCSCCKLNLASDGSIHNHYKSKLHTKGVRKRLAEVREMLLMGDKIFIEVRDKSRNPELSYHIETQEELEDTFKDTETYIDAVRGHCENPITDIYLKRANTVTRANGEELTTWKAVVGSVIRQ